MNKRIYGVTLPIAGHAYLEVEAESEEAAVERAFDTVTVDHLESWEAVQQFTQGNVCYCPHPWSAETRDLGEVEEAAALGQRPSTEGSSGTERRE